jgi:hypothetical protein
LSNYNPYTPPVHDDDARLPPLTGGASWDGTSLTVPKQFSFPRVCLKCGSHEVHTRRTQKFAFTPMWARLLVVVCWPGAVVAMLLTTKRATLELPLCDPCHTRWRQARTVGTVLMLLAVVGLLTAAFASGASHSEAAAGLLPLVTLVVIGVLALVVNKFVRPRILQAKKVDDERVTLNGVHPTAGQFVERMGR